MIYLLPARLEDRTRTLLCCGASSSGVEAQSLNRFAFPRERVAAVWLIAVVLIAAYFISSYCILCMPIFGCMAVMRGSLLRSAHAQRFERDYPTFLLSLASSIRTGADPLQALYGCGSLFACDSPLRAEVERVRESINRGEREERVIRSFAAEIAHPDVALFRTAFILARREGSSLAACLHRLAKVTRQRQSFRRRTRAAVAMQRLSAFGVAASALLVTVIQSTGNPKALSDAWHHRIGAPLLMSGVMLIGVGILWMLLLTRSRT